MVLQVHLLIVGKPLFPLRCSALGVQLMRFVFLMKLELQDATDSLSVFLWRDAVSSVRPPFEPGVVLMLTVGVVCSRQELFFGVTAEDAAANQESQSCVCRTLESLCPPEGSTGTFLLNTDSPEHPLPAAPPPEAPPTCRPPCRMALSLTCVHVSSGERPWLDLCLVSYRTEDDVGRTQTCYQICHSAMATPS